MQVPVYERQARQEGIPKVQQNIQVDASNFLGGTEAAALKYGEQAANDLNKAALHHYEQQLQEANETMSRDAIQQYRTSAQQAMYGKVGEQNAGFLNLRGKDAFVSVDGKSPAMNLTDDMASLRSGIESTLTNSYQKEKFAHFANAQDSHNAALMQQHEGGASRDYTKSTLLADNLSLSRDSELNNNNPALIQKNNEALINNHKQLALLEGHDEKYGEEMARLDISKSLKIANDTAMTQGNIGAVQENIKLFGPYISPDALNNLKSDAVNGYGAATLQADPHSLAMMTDHKLSSQNAVLMQESGGKNYDKNGKILTSDHGALGDMQVLPSTAKAPGFGIAPAQNDTIEELHRVGVDYHSALYNKYKGDTAKVHAAYNAGPGTVDKAIEKGGDNWQDHIPAFTRDHYIPETAARMQTGTPLDYATPEQRLRLNRQAESALASNNSIAIADNKNAMAAQYTQTYNTGVSGDIMPRSSFTMYGADGDKVHVHYLDSQQHAMEAFSMKNQTLDQMKERVEASRPKPPESGGSVNPDFPREQKQYDELNSIYEEAKRQHENQLKIAEHVMTERQKHPGEFMQSVLHVAPLSGGMETVPAQLASRVPIAQDMETKYGTRYAMMSDAEAVKFGENFNQMTPKEAVNYSSGLSKALDERSYKTVMTEAHQAHPVTLLAAQLAGIDTTYHQQGWPLLSRAIPLSEDIIKVNGQKAAELMLTGQRIMDQTKEEKKAQTPDNNLYDPNNASFQTAFDAATNGAFANHPDIAKNTFDAVKAVYVGLSAGLDDRFKDKNNNAERFNEALTLVTGAKNGALSVFGNKVIPPYGMPEDVFIDRITQGFDEQMKSRSPDKIHSFHSAEADISNYKITPLDNGFYGFSNGNGLQPIVVNLSKNNQPDPIAAEINR